MTLIEGKAFRLDTKNRKKRTSDATVQRPKGTPPARPQRAEAANRYFSLIHQVVVSSLTSKSYIYMGTPQWIKKIKKLKHLKKEFDK